MKFKSLKNYCRNIIPFTDTELELIDSYFEHVEIDKTEMLLKEGDVCNFVAFIEKGSVKHYRTLAGQETECDVTREKGWVTDFLSFTYNTPGSINLQPVEKTSLFLVRKDNLLKLYGECSKFETIGRHMADEVAERAIAMSMKKS